MRSLSLLSVIGDRPYSLLSLLMVCLNALAVLLVAPWIPLAYYLDNTWCVIFVLATYAPCLQRRTIF